VISVESHRGWYEQIAPQLPENAHMTHAGEQADYVQAIHRHDHLFDVIVIDGDYRNECATEAAKRLHPFGFIIFDNSDRRAHEQGVTCLRDQGFLQIDFFGMIPSYLYKNCTSIFFKDPALLRPGIHPANHQSCVGQTQSQAMNE
jgi:hypothetical protein